MIHREGFITIIICAVIFTALYLLLSWLFPFLQFLFLLAALGGIAFVIQFFRNPRRPIPKVSDRLIYAPADGKVVVIEKVHVKEYFNDYRIQVSIFMSTWNVHVNRVPIKGKVAYLQYHPGNFLVAWHPKSSTENERNTLVIQGYNGKVMIRQIAGAVARRIRQYLHPNEEVQQGQELGFIKFGSRVDLLLPLDTKVEVKVGDKVKGNLTVIGELDHRLRG